MFYAVLLLSCLASLFVLVIRKLFQKKRNRILCNKVLNHAKKELKHINVDVRDIPTLYVNPGTSKYGKRLEHMQQLVQNIGMRDAKHYKSSAKAYPSCLTDTYASILEQHLDDEPLLILEDDVQWNGYHAIEVPADADAIYLGICRIGHNHSLKKSNTYAEISHVSDNVVKVHNMLSLHAIVYKSKRFKQAVAELFRKHDNDNNVHCDVLITTLQPHFNVYALRTPLFWQSREFNNAPEDDTRITFESCDP